MPMKHGFPIFRRELMAYFRSPVAYVFIIIFLISTTGTTWSLGNFYRSDESSLEIFFFFHPWLYLFLIPAVGMRAFVAVALVLTFPMILTTYYLGSPDGGLIVTGYLGSLLMAGSFLAISCFTSSLTKNQVISFILSFIICLVLMLLGWGVLSRSLEDIFSVAVADIITQFSFTTHFNALRTGVINLRDVVFFLSIIGVMLVANVMVLDTKKAF